jgi:hypothetical protein
LPAGDIRLRLPPRFLARKISPAAYTPSTCMVLRHLGNVADAKAKARLPEWKYTIKAGDGYSGQCVCQMGSYRIYGWQADGVGTVAAGRDRNLARC